MKRTTPMLWLAAVAAMPAAFAMQPAEMQAHYETEARRADAAFTASAERGKSFFTLKRTHSEQSACTTCHTEKPTANGQHFKTGKEIKPLAPAANASRFTDLAKSEKWFGRNCGEVVGRACSAQEKADFIAFLRSVN